MNCLHFSRSEGIGYWAYRSNRSKGLTVIAPTVEVHQNTARVYNVTALCGPFQVVNFSGTTSLTNLEAGSTFEFATQSQLSAAYGTPVGSGVDRQYDGALTVMFSRLGN